MDETTGYRNVIHRFGDGGRQACIHGNVCREYIKQTGRIISVHCPYNCRYYEPKKKQQSLFD